ncbi:MAG: hypothetical protein AABZ39_05670 [Spirochaetota bacterium]
MKKVKSFIDRLVLVLIILSVLLSALYLSNMFFHFLDDPLYILRERLDYLNTVLSSELIAGLSLGSLVLAIVIYMLPKLIGGINRKAYERSLRLGIISSLVFFLSNILYTVVLKHGRVYLFIAIIITGIVTTILVQVLSLMFEDKEKEVSFRTDIVSGISSGLIFGILIHVIMFFIDYIKRYLP